MVYLLSITLNSRMGISEEQGSPAPALDEKSLFRFWLEKPLGIGLSMGFVFGALNSIVLEVAMLPSVVVGAALGLTVCSVACPGMRTRMKARRERNRQSLLTESSRVRAGSAFSTFD